MKKTAIYSLVLVVLLALGVFTWFNQNKESNETSPSDFAINSSEVTKLELKNKQGNEMTLEKVDGTWMVNDRYPAREQFVKDLLSAMENIYAAAPIADVAHENVLIQLSKKATKVSIYLNGKDKITKEYYVGGLSPLQDGTNMLMIIDGKPADRAYNVKLPGHKGYITEMFYIDEVIWRERTIFSYIPSEIASVSVEYFQEDSVHSFKLNNDNNNYTLETPSWTFTSDDLNTQLVANYLLGFDKKGVESYHNEYEKKDSIMQDGKYAQLTIVTKDNSEMEMPIYYMPVNASSSQQYDEQGIRVKHDVDRLYALVNDRKDWALIQTYTFNNILIPSNKFLKK